jgi:hypothetical protein
MKENPAGWDAHRYGDYDGLGACRGLMFALLLDAVAAGVVALVWWLF